jgi:hypothetical protein
LQRQAQSDVRALTRAGLNQALTPNFTRAALHVEQPKSASVRLLAHALKADAVVSDVQAQSP